MFFDFANRVENGRYPRQGELYIMNALLLTVSLIILGVALLAAAQKGWIDDQRLANIVAVLAFIAALAVFFIPQASQPTSEPTIQSTPPVSETPTVNSETIGGEEPLSPLTTPFTATATESVNFTTPMIQPSVDIDTILPNIVSGSGGIEIAAPWWKAITVARENGTYDPTEFPGAEGCFGVAWNVQELFHTVVVFQSAQTLDFQAGGHYSLICITTDVELSAIDVGKVQSTWLSKEHGGTWRVQVLD